jgi:GTP-binding protein
MDDKPQEPGREARKPPHPLIGAEFIEAAAAPHQFPELGPPEIAFAGRSNAGKSSAINALATRTRLAFASRTPGRTQHIVFFRLRSGALVADLPGYGYAAVPKALKDAWQEFLWGYIVTRPTLVALVLMVDSRHGIKPADEALLDGFLPSGRPVLILATKVDKLTATERRTNLAALDARLREYAGLRRAQITVIPFSATRREGIEAAETLIESWVVPG